ncbi:MAG: MFS transporter [Hormoscilla sp. GM102CHS1]|nr:MFS transporter [Hormoscilla sp. GM102CHS1]
MTTDLSQIEPESEKLSFFTKLAYGAGDMGPAITANVLVFFLLPFFTDVAGISAGLAGTILMVGKISDALNDPVVGFLSDRTRHPWGRRYPWIVFGSIPFGIIFFLQWVVPGFGEWGLFCYYVAIGVLFNIAYTAVSLPYTALTPELTKDYNERTNLNSFRFAFSIGGSILSLVLATFIFSQVQDTGQRYLVLGIVYSVISVLPLYLCVWGTRKRVAAVQRLRVEDPEDSEASLSLPEQLRVAFSNRPFLFVIGIYLCSWLAVQVIGSVMKYFVVDLMGLEPQFFPQVALTVQGTAFLMLFVWTRVSDRFGKKTVYYMGTALWLIAQIILLYLQPDQVGLMYLLAVIAGCGVAVAYLVPWSMLPDVIDLDELRTGQRREGVFYAFMVLLQKLGLAIGLFLVGQALDWSGYIENVAGEPIPVQPDSTLLAIRLSVAVLPAICLLGGIVLAYFYPITREVHADILLQLRERQQQDDL